ncbi:MAG: hypothetical protein DRI84_09280 [Bacteroidetes bacterium]|nr:MAG: hypothetical protein DRI84_09280 [Bacteroidota bacterium]
MKEKKDIENISKELEGFSKLQSLKGKQPFSVPDSYFDNLEDNIISKIAKEAGPRKIRMNTKQVLFYAAAASIVAIFIFIAMRSGNQDANQPQIADQPTETINQENPIANNNNQKEESIVDQRNDENIHRIESIEKNAVAVENDKNLDIQNQEIRNNTKDNNLNHKNTSNFNYANNDLEINNDGNLNINNGQTISSINGVNTSIGNSTTIARKAVHKYLDLGNDRCSSKAIRLDASVKHARDIKYQWSTKDTTSIIIAQESGLYWVNVYDLNDNLLGSDTVTITIIEKPRPNLGGDRSICNYESILISSGCRNTEYYYKWSVSDATTAEVYLSNMDPGTYQIELSVMSCSDTATSSMILTVNDCNLKIPNVITPNGDGRNDRFIISGLNHYSGSKLYIMDRTGSIVYESIDYKNDWAASNVQEGTYFYRLLLNDGKNTEKNGTLTIIRK